MAPGYALTWAHLGKAYTANASFQFGGREQYREAESAFERALFLHPDLIEARVYMIRRRFSSSSFSGSNL